MKSRAVCWSVVAAAGCLALSGCFTPNAGRNDEGANAAPSAPSVVVESPPPAKPARRPVAAKKAPPAAKPTVQLAKAEPAPEPVAAKPPPNLIGMDERQLNATLGMPTELVEKAPGRLMRYRGASCTLDVSMFPDVETRVFRVLAIEVISDDNTAEGKQRCVSERHASAAAQ